MEVFTGQQFFSLNKSDWFWPVGKTRWVLPSSLVSSQWQLSPAKSDSSSFPLLPPPISHSAVTKRCPHLPEGEGRDAGRRQLSSSCLTVSLCKWSAPANTHVELRNPRGQPRVPAGGREIKWKRRCFTWQLEENYTQKGKKETFKAW